MNAVSAQDTCASSACTKNSSINLIILGVGILLASILVVVSLLVLGDKSKIHRMKAKEEHFEPAA